MTVSSNNTSIANIIVQYCYAPDKNNKEKSQQLYVSLLQFFPKTTYVDSPVSPITTITPSFLPIPIKMDPHLPAGKESGLENRKFWVPSDEGGSTFSDPKDSAQNPSNF